MAIGKINGPMLFSNLERQGVNLAIDSNVAYFDVNNRYVGINTSSPAYALDSPGNARLSNLVIAGNTITSNTGKINLGSISNVVITGGTANYVAYTDGAGNLGFANLATLTQTEGFTANLIPLGSNTKGSLSSVAYFTASDNVTNSIAVLNQILGNFTNSGGNSITVTGNITGGNLVTTGNMSIGNLTVTGVFAVGGNISANLTGNIYTDYIGTYRNVVTSFQSNTAVKVPAGTTANRPVGVAGYMRFNSDLGVVEYYNGSAWVSVTNTFSDQIIYPDGLSYSFALTQSTTAAGILVSINGTIQQPDIAYSVSGSYINFAEIPLATDVIDIRYISSTVTVDSTVSANIISLNSNITAANAAIAAINSNVLGVNVAIASINSNVLGVNVAIASINANVSAANAAIITLQTQAYSNSNVNAYLTTGTGNINVGNISVNGNITSNLKFSDGTTITSGKPRVSVLTDATSVTFNCDTTDMAVQVNTQTAGTLTINAPIGTPSNGQKLLFRLQSTNVQTFSFNAIFTASSDLVLPTASSGSSKYDYLAFIYNSTATKWHFLGKNFGF